MYCENGVSVLQDEEAEEEQALKPHPDADTLILFTKPTGTGHGINLDHIILFSIPHIVVSNKSNILNWLYKN